MRGAPILAAAAAACACANVSALLHGPPAASGITISTSYRRSCAPQLRMATLETDSQPPFHKYLWNGMKYVKLGTSDLMVSEVCLGTMTWGGAQNTDEDAREQLDVAFNDYGVNFIDTAEIYPVPPSKETQGNTDRAIAKWLKGRDRSDVVLASKVSGWSAQNGYLRDSGKGSRVQRDDIVESVDKSLARLGTDYIDLLQIHWPDRYVPLFGDEPYNYAKERDDAVPIEEQLRGMEEVIKAGKVRYIGLSNETPFGVARFVEIAERLGLPRVVSVQNSYSLLVRADHEMGGMVETCAPWNCNMGMLAYSPLAGGVLSGKYQRQGEEHGRLTMFKGYMERYRNSPSEMAVKAYSNVAESLGLTPTQLALAWCYSRPFVTSTIIGATSIEQLHMDLQAYNCPITPKAETLIASVYHKNPDPTKSRR